MLRKSWIVYYFLFSSAAAQMPVNNENFTVKDGLSENVVYALFQDKNGFIWVGTHEGLNRYDGYGFKKYLHDKNDSTSLPNNPINKLFGDEDGNLLVMGGEGFSRMDRTTEKFQLVNINFSDFFYRKSSLLHPSHSEINFNLDFSWHPLSKKKSTGIPFTALQKTKLNETGWLATYFDAQKRLWILRPDKLIVFDENGGEKTILSGLQLEQKAGLNLNKLFDDPNGNIWIPVPGKLICIDKSSCAIKLTVYQNQIKDLPIENIQALLLDRSGVLWIGSFYGLKKVNLSHQYFDHITSEEKKLASNFVLGLNIHSGNKLSAQHYFLDSLYSEIQLSSKETKHHRVEDVSFERFLKETLIKNVDRVEKRSLDQQLKKIAGWNLDRRMIRYLYADKEGSIWSFYVYGKVINLLNDRTIDLKGTAEGLWDDDKYLWVATTSIGLIRYDKSSGEIKNYRSSNTDSAAIGSDNLLCLVPDQHGNLWIGTRAGGLNYFDKTKETFTHYTEGNGLSNNTIYCMVTDSAENLWMGTANGLSCFEITKNTFRNFYISDGLVNSEYNRWSAIKDNNDILYFGGMNGIDYFKSGEVLQTKTILPAVQITAFKTGNQRQQLRQGIALDHQQNFISFEFAAMDFRNPSATQYMYMLQGANNDWINVKENRTAVFAGLPPGKYVFKVKGATQNGQWSEESSLAFTILTPWWQKTWFYVLCMLLVAAVLYAIYRFRVNQLRKLFLVRTKISQDLHDEVGATLTSISFLSEVAKEQAARKDHAADQTIHKIGDYSREMIGEMNDIVWAVNPANDKFEKIADRIRNFASPLLAAKNIQFDFREDAQLKYVSLDMQQRKNLYLIFKEALNNAVKYAECGNVKVNIHRENNHIYLEIIDDGKGFVESDVAPGNGLTNIRQRAKEVKAEISIRSKPGKGTAISLSIPITQNA